MYAHTRSMWTQEVRLQENNFPAYQSWLLTCLLNSLTGVQLSCNTHLKLSLGTQADERNSFTHKTHTHISNNSSSKNTFKWKVTSFPCTHLASNRKLAGARKRANMHSVWHNVLRPLFYKDVVLVRLRLTTITIVSSHSHKFHSITNLELATERPIPPPPPPPPPN